MKVEVNFVIKSRPSFFLFLVFCDKAIIERTNLLFPVSRVNENNGVVSLISIAILFLGNAFSQIN